MKGFRIVLWFGAVALLGTGCSAQLSQASATEPGATTDQHRYAAALDEAFDTYESEVTDALAADYETQAEAEAVALSLAPHRFDAHLAVALEKRGLTVDGLGRYARAHQRFFQEQRARHHGRMELLRHALASLAQRAPADTTVALR